ncbi:Bifunctional protein FolD protein [compost metagenome]|uniref:bifunctional 5,10-methylenetetrahydrofolate dehydrogenase/5,10-methenyltetrahydrofolate cyclohydrolase n=1 Tax=Paenibacillus sp. EKM212P TaxID=1683680 RepID=UPI000FB1C003|nr:bifunctional 5,10-methylenetetrahydrofolate dehydrogenase/5,10-methenyltetrahydrofolate cyclohydrolase [Paenibacillus sp. EKM212P]KAF6576218.1 bifunctional 5,10-methylenetetrahydrofolate dehydrogenase/5,10-methenyltetrahydrofolate cyclohydrolase [Paenibacillus sp. EKM212P]
MAIIMKSKEAAEQVYATIRSQVEEMKQQGHRPHLATLLVEGDPASAYYARTKQKIAEKLGISFHLHTFDRHVSETELLHLISSLNDAPHVHGIMLELPLPQHLSASVIKQSIAPYKDIDGITPDNKLATVTGDAGLYPATPQACIELLKHYGHTLAGKNVTLVGIGQTVGLPLFHMLQRENATVTACHAGTRDIAEHLSHADIAFVAVGCPDVITQDMVHPGLILVDAGINETLEGKIVGDAALDVGEKVHAISPVPGGVGTLTTAILYKNLLKAIHLQHYSREVVYS